jgi:hypothetical protein
MSWTVPITHATGDPIVVSDFNTYVRDNANFLYGDAAWTTATLGSGWTEYGSGYFPVGYRKWGPNVQLRGTAISGPANPAFTLPIGYRPGGYGNYPLATNGTGEFCFVGGDGIVQVDNFSASSSYTFDGIIIPLL